jgi:hypothetical protein
MTAKTEAERKTHAQRQKEYYRRMVEKGWKRLSVWVPGSHIEEFDAMYNKLVDQWSKAASKRDG